MRAVYYVFELDGPYGWRPAEYETGPYYDTHSWFNEYGYDTEEDANKAVEEVISSDVNYSYGPYFVIKGYTK